MDKPIILCGGLLIDGTDGNPVTNGAVMIEGSRITALGRADEIIARSPNAMVIDRKDETILPGLIDCHNHLSMDPTLENYLDHMNDSVAEQVLRATVTMRKDLFSGVTTSRCCGDKEFLDIACREAVQNGLVDGPRLLVATRGIRASHGHGFVGYPFDGPEELRKAVRENINAGADFIKFYITGTLKGSGQIPSYLSRQEISTIVEEAHRAGLLTAAHCVGGKGMDWALKAGLDSLEHGYHITDSQIEQLRASGSWLVLTPSPILTEERVNNLPPEHISGYREEKALIASRMTAVIRAGIEFALGTDGMHGEFTQEIIYIVELGATPIQALRAATLNGAKVCGIDNITGSLEAGKVADIITVKGNPLDDISVMKETGMVIKKGKVMSACDRSPAANERMTSLGGSPEKLLTTANGHPHNVE